MNTTERTPNKSIELSTAAKNFNGATNTYFKTELVNVRALAKYLTLHNYSAIHWRDGSRKESNFIKAVAFIGDYDENKTIQEVHDDLKSQRMNHLIIPSKSHTPEHHKFHVVIFFSNPVYSASGYKKIAAHIASKILPGSDTAVTDAARYIYGSPADADAISYLDGKDFNVNDLAEIWNMGTNILDKDENPIDVVEISTKTPIFCPFHEDSNPSAFISYSSNSDNWYINCSSCDKTYWMEKDKSHLEKVCEPYWSYGTEIWDFGMVNDEFFYEKLGSSKFHIITNTEGREEKSSAMRYLVQRKHIRHLSRIDYQSNINAKKSYYEVDLGKGVITAHHQAIPVKIRDNDYVEQYLEDRFGIHKEFIKEWLAVYCHSNYRKLPSLIFSGGRGTGKSTFAEIMGEIYPTMSFQWSGNEEGFTYEVEKKLLIVEENISDKVSQYKTLKKYTGQKYATVKKKFKDPYQVKNNVNIVLLSNELIPLFVSREELPTDTKNNQFFVYEFSEFTGSIDPDLQDKVLARIGHYIRTELKTIYDDLPTTGYRYSIDVPISDEEKELFAANTSDQESDVDMLMDRLLEQYNLQAFPDDMPIYSFIKKGQLPVKWIKYYSQSGQHYNKIIKGMRRQRLVFGSAEKVQVDKKREFCLTMTDKLIKMINDTGITDLDNQEDKIVSGVSKKVSGNSENPRQESLI